MNELWRRIRLAYAVLRHGFVLPPAKKERRTFAVVWHMEDGKQRPAYTGKDVIRARQVYEETFHRHEVIGAMITVDGTPDASWGALKRVA